MTVKPDARHTGSVPWSAGILIIVVSVGSKDVRASLGSSHVHPGAGLQGQGWSCRGGLFQITQHLGIEGPWNVCPASLSTWGNGPEEPRTGSRLCSNQRQSGASHQVACCLSCSGAAHFPALPFPLGLPGCGRVLAGRDLALFRAAQGLGSGKGSPSCPGRMPRAKGARTILSLPGWDEWERHGPLA